MSKINQLQEFAIKNYEAGGHWVVECFSQSDYTEYIQKAGGNVQKACKLIKEYWELINEQELNCAWDGPNDEI